MLDCMYDNKNKTSIILNFITNVNVIKIYFLVN
jgi:hypothetical protein